MNRLYISPEDFFRKAADYKKYGAQEEQALAAQMRAGSSEAREALFNSYLPLLSGCIQRLPREYHSLELVMRCCAALEKALDSFDFSQTGESFTHRISWILRQTTTAYIADRRIG